MSIFFRLFSNVSITIGIEFIVKIVISNLVNIYIYKLKNNKHISIDIHSVYYVYYA